MKIADVLLQKSRIVHSVRPWLTVGDVVDQLNRFAIGAVLVCDEQGGLRGIVSERDIVRGLGRHGVALLTQPLTEVMTQHVETTRPEESVARAMTRMTTGRYRHLPVVVDGRIVGLVSIGDLVKNRLTELELETGVLRDRAIAHL
jgi:CBS domain-containing protein